MKEILYRSISLQWTIYASNSYTMQNINRTIELILVVQFVNSYTVAQMYPAEWQMMRQRYIRFRYNACCVSICLVQHTRTSRMLVMCISLIIDHGEEELPITKIFKWTIAHGSCWNVHFQ